MSIFTNSRKKFCEYPLIFFYRIDSRFQIFSLPWPRAREVHKTEENCKQQNSKNENLLSFFYRNVYFKLVEKKILELWHVYTSRFSMRFPRCVVISRKLIWFSQPRLQYWKRKPDVATRLDLDRSKETRGLKMSYCHNITSDKSIFYKSCLRQNPDDVVRHIR